MNDTIGKQPAGQLSRAKPAVSMARTASMLSGPRLRRGNTHSYSRFVSMTKVILPVLAVLILALVMAWPHLQAKDSRFRIGFATMKLTGSPDKSMINPRYLGTDKETKPFSVTADMAKNMMGDTTAVDLEMPKADLTLKDGSWLVLTANTGVYDKTKRTLALRDKVNLFHDSGYEFRTSVANIDLTKGLAEGNKPVAGQGPFGSLKSQGFRLIDKGRIIQFKGKSKLIMYPDIAQSVKKKPAKR